MRCSGMVLAALCACHAVGGLNAFLLPSPRAELARGVAALRSSRYGNDVGVGLMDRPRTAAPAPPPGVRTLAPDERGAPDPARHDERRGSTGAPTIRRRGREDAGGYGRGAGRRWWERGPAGTIQGNARSTVRVPHGIGRSEVRLETEGRPLDTEVEVWDGPNNTPTKMRVYSEDGRLRPFRALVSTPSASGGSAISVRNAGPMEFPVSARVGADASTRFANGRRSSGAPTPTTSIQGGSLKTWSLGASVGSVQVTIETDGMPMHAEVELWGCGGHVKQVAEIYNDDGRARPFSALVETPGGANTVCVRNRGALEFPMRASVEIASTESFSSYDGSGYGGNSYGSRPYELPYRNSPSRNWYDSTYGGHTYRRSLYDHSYSNGASRNWYDGNYGGRTYGSSLYDRSYSNGASRNWYDGNYGGSAYESGPYERPYSNGASRNWYDGNYGGSAYESGPYERPYSNGVSRNWYDGNYGGSDYQSGPYERQYRNGASHNWYDNNYGGSTYGSRPYDRLYSNGASRNWYNNNGYGGSTYESWPYDRSYRNGAYRGWYDGGWPVKSS